MNIILAPFRLLGSFLMAMGKLYAYCIIGFTLLFGLPEIMKSEYALSVILILITIGLFAREMLRPQVATQPHSESSEAEDQAPAQPASQALARVNARTEIYRGNLKAQSRE